jgi:hypothetical protein
MDHQLLISAAEKCLFMASNGTKDDCIWDWYETTKERTDAIIVGWKQFQADLEIYELPESKPESVANAIEQLPALNIQIQGSVSKNNLVQYRESAMAYIEAINTDLQTDQDFSDAEANVKFCKNAEDELKRAKAAALSSTVDIDELMKAVDFLSDQLCQKRLTLEKLVKSEKESRKREFFVSAMDEFSQHCLALESELSDLTLPVTATKVDFYDPMKGKRTIESLRNAVNTRLAEAKIEADRTAKAMRDNLAILNDLAGDDYCHLFNDLEVVIHKEIDDFEALVTLRVQQEKDRLEQIRIAAEQKAAEAEPEQTPPTEQAASSVESETKLVSSALESASMRHAEFLRWWDEVGSGIAPSRGEDHETHTKHVAQLAWDEAKGINQI